MYDTSKYDNISSKVLNELVENLCVEPTDNQMYNNNENLNKNNVSFKNAYEEEKAMEKIDEDEINLDIMRDIMKHSEDLSIEDINRLKNTDAYIKYNNQKDYNNGEDITDSMEEELMRDIMRSSNNHEGEIIDETMEENINDRFQKDNGTGIRSESFNETIETKNVTINDTVQENKIDEKITIEDKTENELSNDGDVSVGDNYDNESQNSSISEEDIIKTTEQKEELSREEIEDLPISDLDVDDSSIIKNSINKFNITENDALKLIRVINRYKSGEKFNVYNELPDILKNEIKKDAMEYNITDKSTINFLSKNLINSIIEDTYMNDSITDIEKQLEELTAPLGNVSGLIVDTFTDSLTEKFETNLQKVADEIKDKEPDNYNRLMTIKKNFIDSYNLNKINEMIDNNPYNINRAYKEGRDRWNKVVSEFEKETADVNPKIRSIEVALRGLKSYGVRDDYAKTICVLIRDTIRAAMKTGIEGHIYSYYIMIAFVNLNVTTNTSNIIIKLKKAIDTIVDKIDDHMTKLNNQKKSKKRK